MGKRKLRRCVRGSLGGGRRGRCAGGRLGLLICNGRKSVGQMLME